MRGTVEEVGKPSVGGGVGNRTADNMVEERFFSGTDISIVAEDEWVALEVIFYLA